MSYPTHEEIRQFISTYGLTDEDLCLAEGLDPNEDCSEMGINLGYIWSSAYAVWFNKNNSKYTDKDEQILDLFKDSHDFKLPQATRKVTLTVTRYYSKQTTFEVDVDENLTGEALQEFLTNDADIEDMAEDGLGEASLCGDETKWEYQDPTNQDGGHL